MTQEKLATMLETMSFKYDSQDKKDFILYKVRKGNMAVYSTIVSLICHIDKHESIHNMRILSFNSTRINKLLADNNFKTMSSINGRITYIKQYITFLVSKLKDGMSMSAYKYMIEDGIRSPERFISNLSSVNYHFNKKDSVDILSSITDPVFSIMAILIYSGVPPKDICNIKMGNIDRYDYSVEERHYKHSIPTWLRETFDHNFNKIISILESHINIKPYDNVHIVSILPPNSKDDPYNLNDDKAVMKLFSRAIEVDTCKDNITPLSIYRSGTFGKSCNRFGNQRPSNAQLDTFCRRNGVLAAHKIYIVDLYKKLPYKSA